MKLKFLKSKKGLVNIGALSVLVFGLSLEVFIFPFLSWEYRIFGLAFALLSLFIFIWSLKDARKKSEGANTNTQLQDSPPAIIEKISKQ